MTLERGKNMTSSMKARTRPYHHSGGNTDESLTLVEIRGNDLNHGLFESKAPLNFIKHGILHGFCES